MKHWNTRVSAFDLHPMTVRTKQWMQHIKINDKKHFRFSFHFQSSAIGASASTNVVWAKSMSAAMITKFTWREKIMWFFGYTNKQPSRTKLMIHTRTLSLSLSLSLFLLLAHFGGVTCSWTVLSGCWCSLWFDQGKSLAINQFFGISIRFTWCDEPVLLHFDKSVQATDRQHTEPLHANKRKPSTRWKAREIEITESSMKSISSRKPRWRWVAVFRRTNLLSPLLNGTVVRLTAHSFYLAHSAQSLLAVAVRNRTRWKFEINGFVGEST